MYIFDVVKYTCGHHSLYTGEKYLDLSLLKHTIINEYTCT